MIEHTLPTGTNGELKIVDNTDDPELMTVQFFIKIDPAITSRYIQWTYSIDGIQEPWKSSQISEVTTWQALGGAYVGTSQTTTLHLADTGITELAGPTDLTVNLYGYVPEGGVQDALAWIRDQGTWKRAIPYVNDGGSWKKAVPYIRRPTGWKQAT